MSPPSASDVLSFRDLNDVQFSSDGKHLAYVVSDPYRIKGEEVPRSAVWVHDFESNVRYCVSGVLSNASSPRFSNDGAKLCFLAKADRSSSQQLYLLDIPSGRLLQPTAFEKTIEGFEWSPGGDRLFLLMRDKAEDSEDPEEFEGHHVFTNLYTMELRSGELRQLSEGSQIWDFAIAPDASSVIALASSEPYEWAWHVAKLVLIDVESRQSRTVFDPEPRQIGSLRWTGDGKRVCFISSIISDRGLIGGDLFIFSPFNGEKPRNLTNNGFGTVHYYDFADASRILLLSVNMAKSAFFLMDVSQGGEKTVSLGSYDFWVNPRFQPRFSLGSSGNAFAVVREDPANQQEIWTGGISGNSITWQQQTELNKSHVELLRGDCRLVEWKSQDGTLIQGFLYSLPGSSGKSPLIVNIHGGPSMSYGYTFNQQARFFLARGFSVFLPNPRGSTGRGPAFSEMNRGNIEGKDFDDILAGIDHLTSQGLADPSNLFVMGGSYGGYLVAWAITHSRIFNAAVMNFGISNLLSCHGTEFNIYWDEFLFDINPYKEPEKYHRKSPIDYVSNVQTPTLILHGKEDPCVPVTQGRELFRALKELGVETGLVVYPREKHGWTEKEHIIDGLQRQCDWFTRHLKR